MDNFPKNLSQLASLQKAHAGVLPDLFVCLIDGTDGGRKETLDSNTQTGRAGSGPHSITGSPALLPGSTLLKRMYEMDRGSVDEARRRRLEAQR